MQSESVKELLRCIKELHRFERSKGTLEDLKAVIVDTRSALTSVKGEILGNMMKMNLQASDAREMGSIITNSFTKAIEACNLAAIIADIGQNLDTRTLATSLIVNGNLSEIEALLKGLK